MKRREIEDNLRDDLAFRDELVADRDKAKETAEADYLAALDEIENRTRQVRTNYLDALAEADERIERAERAIEKWKSKLARLDR